MMQLRVIDGNRLIRDDDLREYTSQQDLERDMREKPSRFVGYKWTLHEPRPIVSVTEEPTYKITKEK